MKKNVFLLLGMVMIYSMSYAQWDDKCDKIVFYFGDNPFAFKDSYDPCILRAKKCHMKLEVDPRVPYFPDIQEVFFSGEDVFECTLTEYECFQALIIIDVIYREKIVKSIAFRTGGDYIRNDGADNNMYKADEKMILWLEKVFGKRNIDLTFFGIVCE